MPVALLLFVNSMNPRFCLIPFCLLVFASAFPADAQDSSATGFAKSTIKAGQVYTSLLREAVEAYNKKDFSVATAKLDEADKIKPDLFDSVRIRASILAEKKDFARARELYEKALQIQPNSFWPKFNLSEILLTQKKYAEARAGFENLMVADQFKEMVDFKIIITYLGEGNAAKAKELIGKMKFPSDSGAYYFANAAWEFTSGNKEKGNEWIHSANSIFGPSRNYPFYDTLADMGWVPARPVGAEGAQ